MICKKHDPVMPEEIIRFFSGLEMRVFVDATVGGGGHAGLLLKNCIDEKGLLIGFDQDAQTLKVAEKNLSGFSQRVKLINGNFSEMNEEIKKIKIKNVDGILMDLGVSSFQLDSKTRGFSFRYDSPLDMRMDFRKKKTAYDVVNFYDLNELREVFRKYSDVRNPGRVARMIVEKRQKSPIKTTYDLRSIFEGGKGLITGRRTGIHPATTIFQAIRIEVNNELDCLKKGLNNAFQLLRKGGILAVISFHSLEDRIVKNFFREKSLSCRCPDFFPKCLCNGVAQGKIITKKPLTPSSTEIRKNPRSRSAKLRVISSNIGDKKE